MSEDLFNRLMEYASIGFFVSAAMFLFVAILKATQDVLNFIQ